MLIYSPHISSRLLYIAAWLGEQTGTTPVCTDNEIIFEKSEEIKINYSESRFSPQEIWIKPEGLLKEYDIQQQWVLVSGIHQLPTFFRNDSDLGFDYFSAAFYLISRYEEYKSYREDLYGRYPHNHSIAFINHFLHRPIVDEWTLHFINKIRMVFPEIAIHPPSFSYTPTYDIDISWSYKGKGILRNLGGSLRSPNTFLERILVLMSLKKDPFDAYSFLEKNHSKFNLSSIYFFLTATKRSNLDKNISPYNKSFRKLIRDISEKSEIAVHPSVFSHSDKNSLSEEKDLLALISNKVITKARFHYLNCRLPEDYRRLIEAGITDDYTMGYGTINGFRASTSRSFLWYDLEKEKTTSLRIHPFCWMDANSCYEQQMNTQEAYAELLTYMNQVKQVNGTMITVSHNHLLGEDSVFKGWKEMYGRFLEEVSATK